MMQRIRIFIKYKVLASPLKIFKRRCKKKKVQRTGVNRIKSQDPTLEAIRTLGWLLLNPKHSPRNRQRLHRRDKRGEGNRSKTNEEDDREGGRGVYRRQCRSPEWRRPPMSTRSPSPDARAAEGWGRRTEKREEEKERKRGGAM